MQYSFLQKKSIVLSSSTIQEVIKDAPSELPATIGRVVKESIAESVPVSDPSYAAATATPVVPVIPVSAQADNHWTHELMVDGISGSKGEFNSQTESHIFNLNSILSHLGKENHVRVKSFRRLGKKNPDASRPRTFFVEFLLSSCSARSLIARSFYPSLTS